MLVQSLELFCGWAVYRDSVYTRFELLKLDANWGKMLHRVVPDCSILPRELLKGFLYLQGFVLLAALQGLHPVYDDIRPLLQSTNVVKN